MLHKHGFISGFLQRSLVLTKNQSRKWRGRGKISPLAVAGTPSTRDAIPDLPTGASQPLRPGPAITQASRPAPEKPGHGRTPRSSPAAGRGGPAAPAVLGGGRAWPGVPSQRPDPRHPPLTCRRPQRPRSSSAPPRPRHPTGRPRPLRPLLLGEPEPGPPSHWPAALSVCPTNGRVTGRGEGRQTLL